MSGTQGENPPPPPPQETQQTPTQQTPQTVSTIKLPILKKGEYDIWAMKIEHYLAHTDYPIWEVIQNGNGPVSVTTDTSGQIKILPPKTGEEVVARERERKARTTLLMAIPEDHLAKFHKMTDAKEMWNAIKSRFGGNDESKKMQKYILKQQFEGFTVSNTDGIHKGYERFQSLLSQNFKKVLRKAHEAAINAIKHGNKDNDVYKTILSVVEKEVPWQFASLRRSKQGTRLRGCCSRYIKEKKGDFNVTPYKVVFCCWIGHSMLGFGLLVLESQQVHVKKDVVSVYTTRFKKKMQQGFYVTPYKVSLCRWIGQRCESRYYCLVDWMISTASMLDLVSIVRWLLVLPGDLKSRGSIEDFVSFKEMITSQLQGKLWLYDEVRTRLCLFCHHQIGEDCWDY
ncbi:hypothetical protein Tco_1255095 [Tanacetum coccineum]